MTHPHSYVDQQVKLSLAPDAATVTVVIVPSSTEGAAILASLDTDGSGGVELSEASSFANAVLTDVVLVLDGQAVALTDAAVSMPPADQIAAGTGAIQIRAQAVLTLPSDQPHEISFTISYDDLSHDWFVQPFYHDDLLAGFGAPGLSRSPQGDSVTITLTPKPES